MSPVDVFSFVLFVVGVVAVYKYVQNKNKAKAAAAEEPDPNDRGPLHK